MDLSHGVTASTGSRSSGTQLFSTLCADDIAQVLTSHFGLDASMVRDSFYGMDLQKIRSLNEKELEALGLSRESSRQFRLQLDAWEATEAHPKPKRKGSDSYRLDRVHVSSLSDLQGPTPRLQRRRSLDELFKRGSFLRRFAGSSTSAIETGRSSRLDVRLDQELRRYAKRRNLPDEVVKLVPRNRLSWVATIKPHGTDITTQALISVPDNYPFHGPRIDYHGYSVHFIMGQQYHDATSFTLQANWTPAQSVADALKVALDAVRRARLEDERHPYCASPSPASTPGQP